MVLPLGVDTPRTDAGDTINMTNPPFDFSNFTAAESFHSPSKETNDLVRQLKSGRRGLDIRTPRARVALVDRTNNAAPKGEFTPLLKSATRTNLTRKIEDVGKTFLPSFMRQGQSSPALPVEGSAIYGDAGSTLSGQEADATPMPQVASSSVSSTPLAMLPRRDGGGVLGDGANMLTLREQENIINKIEKENFSLKLKIHFLEEALLKAGPGYSEAAAKENTELKVDKVTLQRELHRYRKTLGTAERDLETYRQQVIEAQERMKRKHADQGQEEELRRLRLALENSEAEAQQLRDELASAERRHGEVEERGDEVEDLEAELREKNRKIEDQDDQIEDLKEMAAQSQDRVHALEESLDQAGEELKEATRERREMEESLGRARGELKDATTKRQEVEESLQRARDELRDSTMRRQEVEDEVVMMQGILNDDERMITTKDTELATMKQHVTDERKELHGKLRDAKIQLEELQDQLAGRDAKVDALSKKWEGVRAKGNRYKEELQATSSELETLRRDYDEVVERAGRLQRDWEEDRAALMQRVRFPNTSVSSAPEVEEAMAEKECSEVVRLEQEVEMKDQRHQSEIRGLAKQINYLREKCKRAEGFRADLVFSKKYMQLQIDMYDLCNKADLYLFEQMGINHQQAVPDHRPTIRVVAFMIIASNRMKKRTEQWAQCKMVKDGLVRAVQKTRRRSGRKSAVV